MAKKKASPPPDDNPRRGRPTRPKPGGGPPVKKRSSPGPEPSALLQALDLMERAVQADDPKQRVMLAKQAVNLSPDCAEAYLLLAEEAPTRKEALKWYEEAVAASVRLLGPEALGEWEGHFWGVLETRPYMRARQGLAETLWVMGRRAEAADHIRDLLRLNPNDNQGLRYTLASWLLSLDELDELDALLARFEEDSATWAYTRLLIAFIRSGDTPAVRKLLPPARKANKHVPAYLLGRKPLPSASPSYYSPGDEADAILYVAGHLGAWKSAPGALAWLGSRVKEPARRRPKVEPAEGPTPGATQRLLRLPRQSDIWQADFRQFDRRIEIAGERVRPWMVLVSSRSRDLILAHALTEENPSAATLWDIVTGAMERPAAGKPHRPTKLLVRPGAPWDDLADHFAAIGVERTPAPVLDQLDALFGELAQHLAGVEPPSLLDMPGVTVEQVGGFYQAAAEFYKRAPWRSLGFEAVIQVECDRYQSGPWYAVIMGQSGVTLGLALYEDLDLLRRMWAGKMSEEEGARLTLALTITYDGESSLSEGDLEAIAMHGYPIAAPEAYPSIFRKERGLSMRPPLGWEIDLMVGCLRTLPDFVRRRPPDDPTRELVPVPGIGGSMELGLSWIEEMD